jgi:hypothetical protein
MPMDEKKIALVRQLQNGLFDVSEDQAAQMVREARNEALAEAKTILKWLMVQAILEQATGMSPLAEAVPAKPSRPTPLRSGVLCSSGSGVDTPVLSVAEGPVLSVAEGPVLSVAEGPVLSVAEGPPELRAEEAEQIRQEIEAIRQKIAENERSLSRAKASPTGGEAAPAPPLDTPPAEGGEAGCAYYVYGIVGRDGGQPLEGLPEEGIDPACAVYALPDSHPACPVPSRHREAVLPVPSHRTGRSTDQTLQAIVSQVSLRDFGQERLEENLDDLRWLEARVRVHQDILNKVGASHTLIPMRFCTLYRAEERIRDMLKQHHADFVQALTRLEGKREWGVKVYCDNKVLAQRAGQVSDRVKEIEAEMAAKSSGAAYFLKKKLEETIAAEAERISDEHAQLSHDRLSSHAAEAIISPLQGKELTGRQEAMVLNGAYLVAEDQLAAFRAELASLQDEYGDLGLSYEMTGPWPAYNFAAIDFTASEANRVEEGVADE